jgi:CDP-glycerol glycerophosphotransferase (TagB/SpsB family)
MNLGLFSGLSALKRHAWACLTLPLFWLLRPILRALGLIHAHADGPWVIGSHGGSLREDNARALHEYVLRHGSPEIVWLTHESQLLSALRAAGYKAHRRNGFAARLAIENARALIFSHGETDLDHCFFNWLRPRGLSIHLNHCMNHLKAGQMHQRGIEKLSPAARARLRKRYTHFDYLLCSSERERGNFMRSFPGEDSRIVLGGGAHLDRFMQARAQAPARKLIYFPTFREDRASRRALERVVDELERSERLALWLEQSGYELLLASHVNSRSGGSKAPGSEASRSRIRRIAPSELIDELLDSAALISDYSGLICDYMALDRPLIFFPFDQLNYMEHRLFYVDYDDFVSGPRVDSTSELIALLISETWRNTEPFAEKRKYWQSQLFPDLTPHYSQRTFETIRGLLASSGSPTD